MIKTSHWHKKIEMWKKWERWYKRKHLAPTEVHFDWHFFLANFSGGWLYINFFLCYSFSFANKCVQTREYLAVNASIWFAVFFPFSIYEKEIFILFLTSWFSQCNLMETKQSRIKNEWLNLTWKVIETHKKKLNSFIYIYR